MKKTKIILVMICLFLFVGAAYSISSASSPTAKQMLINKLQSPDAFPVKGFYEKASGNASYEVKTIDGSLVSDMFNAVDFSGTKLDIAYKLDSLAKKMEMNYNLFFNKESYEGDFFIDNDKLIFTTEALSKLGEFNPAAGGAGSYPPYAYLSDSQFGQVWEQIAEYKEQTIPPELKNLIIFFVEALPDKYFAVSLTSQKVTFGIDQKGFEDILFSVFQKIKGEKERFASLMADYAVLMDPTGDKEIIYREMLGSLAQSITSGDYPDSPEKMAEILTELSKVFVLENLTHEISILSAGQSRLLAKASFGAQKEYSLEASAVFNETRDELNGTYDLTITSSRAAQKYVVDGRLNGSFKQTSVKQDHNGLFDITVKDLNGLSILDLSLQMDSSATVDEGVIINIPELNAYNSVDISAISAGYRSDVVKVYVDGKLVSFDVHPFILDGRTMVPVRNVAETLQCQVNWVEPDQINIQSGDNHIIMYIGKNTYTVNGVEKVLDVPPFIKDGKRTVVPIRFVAEELGCRVTYDEKSNTVTVTSNNPLNFLDLSLRPVHQ